MSMRIIRKLNHIKRLITWKGSSHYWNKRYLLGGTSGAGSYNRLAHFKAQVLNDFVEKHSIREVIELGCGDGNQLSLSCYPKYIGYDISEEAIKICKKKFASNNEYSFFCSKGLKHLPYTSELVLSLDVIYHLIEDEVYNEYMKMLFSAATKWVIIYSSNYDKVEDIHVKCRKFTDWIEKYTPDWNLYEYIKNPYPYDIHDMHNTSWSDFYIYKKS